MKRRLFLKTILAGVAGFFFGRSQAAATPPLLELKDDPLARDIAANGILRPIIMHNGIVVDGHRRLAAAKLLGIKNVPYTNI